MFCMKWQLDRLLNQGDTQSDARTLGKEDHGLDIITMHLLFQVSLDWQSNIRFIVPA